MLTESVVGLGKSEEWFWETELRIVWNLIEKHKELEKIKMKNQAIYIASYVWGKDPDEGQEESGKRLIPGVDIPADPEVIGMLM